jgi:hypothetical protein
VARYGQAFKDKAVARLAPPESATLEVVAREVGIGAGTLECGIGFPSVSDNIDTTTTTGKLVFHIVGAMAEFERTLISERMRAGMQAAKRKGKPLGRPRRMSVAQIESARNMVQVGGLSPADVARRMGLVVRRCGAP